MPATVQIRRHTGSSLGTGTDITGINTRANTYDGHSTDDSVYPIQIPASGTNYSYWVTVGLWVTSPPSGVINNLRWYTDGTNGFGNGVTCKVGKCLRSGYVQATGTPGTTGNQLTKANHSGLIDLGGGTYTMNAFNFTSTNPLVLNGSINNPNTGGLGELVVYQIEVSPIASPGVTPAETFTFKYDET